MYPRTQPTLGGVVVLGAAPGHGQFEALHRQGRVFRTQAAGGGEGGGGVIRHHGHQVGAGQQGAQAVELRYGQDHPPAAADLGQFFVDEAAQVAGEGHQGVGPCGVVVQAQRPGHRVGTQQLGPGAAQGLALGVGGQFLGVGDAHGNLAGGQQVGHQ
ncbi:hypothetical protein D3C72_1479460 [compost metagenome]